MKVEDVKIKSTETIDNGPYLVELKLGKAKTTEQNNSAKKTDSAFAMAINPISGEIKSTEKQALYDKISENEAFAIANFENGTLKSIEMTKKMFDIAISGAVEQICIFNGSRYVPLPQKIDPIKLEDEEVALLDNSIRNKWNLNSHSQDTLESSKKNDLPLKKQEKKGKCIIS